MDYFELLQNIVTGLIQGIGEFLPISSSAHLIAVPWIFNWQANGLDYDVLLHLGTFFAVLLYFRKDVYDLVINAFSLLKRKFKIQTPEDKLTINMLLAMIPAGIVGVLFEKTIEEHVRAIPIIIFTMAFMAIVFLIVDKPNKKSSKDIFSMSYKDAILIGCAQCLALVPGFSRSGTTIVAALLLGLNRTSAARFSFLVSLPIIGGAGFLKLKTLVNLPAGSAHDYLSAMFVAFISGFLAIKFLMKLIQTNTFRVFAYYRLVFAILLATLFLLRM